MRQRGASRSSRVSSRSYEQRTNNDANSVRTAYEQRTSSVRTAYEQRANSYEQRVRTRTNNEPGINYKLISIAIGTGVYSRCVRGGGSDGVGKIFKVAK